jgi:hypothetical protein
MNIYIPPITFILPQACNTQEIKENKLRLFLYSQRQVSIGNVYLFPHFPQNKIVIMGIKKISCAVVIAAAASMSAAMAFTEVPAPAPGPSSGATATLPLVGSLVGASLLSFFTYYLH